MTETLLFLNGQPVILTSDGTESLVQNGDSLATGTQSQGASHLQEVKKELFEPQTGGEEANMPVESQLEDVSDVGHAAVQVKVDGKEVPGFMLANQDVNSVVGHSIGSEDSGYELLNSIKSEIATSNEEVDESEAAEFLRLSDQSQPAVLAKEGSFGGGVDGGGNDVFSLGSGGELMTQTQVEGNAVMQNGLADSLDLQSMVRLPMVSSNVDSAEQNVAGSSPGDEQQRNMSTILAIIQGDDGNTQTVELSQEEACRLNLLNNNGMTQQVPAMKTEDSELQIPAFQTQNQVKIETENEFSNGVSPEVMQMQEQVGGNTSCDTSSSDADVSLEPFLLIPEYGADGSLSMLRFHGSDGEPQPKPDANPVAYENQQVETPNIAEKSPPLENVQMFQTPTQNVHKITIPTSSSQPVKRSSTKQHKHIDWKTVTPRFRSMPRVPGSMYLRDIAKRTKFRNLTSFLNTKHSHKSHVTEKEPEVVEQPTVSRMQTITQPSTYHIPVPGLPNATAKISIPGLISTSTSNLIQSSMPGVARGSNIRRIQTQTPQVAEAKTPPLKVENMPIRLSMQPSHSTPTIRTGRLTALHRDPEPSNNRALTIKVSTGPINGSVATTSTSASTPQPAIRCAAESPENVAGASQSTPDSPSLTSIVYCSSGGDDTPFTVHLPGGDNTKPLGSSENPIQLVQQGNTFQALQPVQERQLQQITSLLQQRRITAPPTTHHDEIYDPKTNMKIVYKVVYPEDIVHLNDDDDDDIIWEDGPDGSSEKRRGRKPKDWRKTKLVDDGEDVDVEILEEREGRKNHVSRTRSGRISRPPRHMMKDFKHLHPINFNDDDKDKDGPSIGYSDYDVQNQVETEEKPVEPVIFELPPRKKREVPPLTRLRYTCLTCGKLYMGRIEAHYRKFPDHRREHPLMTSEIQQSYSTIKALSDTAKPGAEEGGEVNKSVLSPTPGTQASETSGEPSLPMETQTTQPMEPETSPHVKNDTSSEVPEFLPAPEVIPVRPTRGRGRGRRGRRARGRGGRFGAPGRPPTTANKPPPTPIPSPITMLEKILGGYSGEEILQAVGQRLLETMTPWQVLCFQAKHADEKGDLQSWQGRIQYLEQLLRDCKEDFNSQLQHSNHAKSKHLLPAKPLALPSIPEGLKFSHAKVEGGKLHQEERPHDRGEQEVKELVMVESDNVKINEDLASVLGVSSGFYKLRGETSNTKELLDLDSSPHVREKRAMSQEIQPLLGEKHKANRSDSYSPVKRMRMEGKESGEVLVADTAAEGVSEGSGRDMDSCMTTSEENSEENDSNQHLPLSPYALPPQMSTISSLTSTLSSTSTTDTAAGTTALSTAITASNFSLPLNNVSSAISVTTLTESQAAPCVTANTSSVTSTTSSSIAIEVPNFSSHSSNSMPVISSCMQMPSMETSLVTTSTMPQVTPMQQMPMGDLDITADDLPRLLSEGTGLVVGAGNDGSDACDAPKLLDTSGDTTDLSEMLFKLQEVTAGISQSQDPSMDQPVYQGPIMASSHQIGGDNNQMMTSQSISTQSDITLTTQGFNPLAQTMITYSTPNTDMKLGTSQASTQPSMPLLTFSGALDTDSDFQGGSSVISGTSESVSKMPDGDNSAQNVSITQPEINLGDERERISLGFSVPSLGGSEFEELLKR